MDRTPKPGEFYRHFKNKLYQIIAVAVHSETGEEMVVYQALYGDFGIYVRPLSMFVSEVDHGKYPEVTQKYRFEKIDRKNQEKIASEEKQPENTEESQSETIPDNQNEKENTILNENLLAFLEAEQYYEKLEILHSRKNKFTAEELSILCDTLEEGMMKGGTPEEQYRAIEAYLEVQVKYDGARLR